MEVTVIPIQSWQDPQGDIVLIYSEHECSIYFGCWSTPGEPADYICQLSFQRAAAVRSYPREFLPYPLPGHAAAHYILRILGSDLLNEHVAYRRQYYPEFPFDPSQHRHFVITGHDIYHEILATGFSETTIPASELTDERLIALHRNV